MKKKINKKFFIKKFFSKTHLTILKDWSFIKVKGSDSKKYLHEKLTGNILKLKKKKHILTSHCTFNGKIWSIMRIFHYKKGFGYITRKSIVKKHLKEIKKYALFSNVKFKKKKKLYLE